MNEEEEPLVRRAFSKNVHRKHSFNPWKGDIRRDLKGDYRYTLYTLHHGIELWTFCDLFL